MVHWEKSNMVSSTSSRMKNIVTSPARSRFPVKLIYCITFRSTSSTSCPLKSIIINI